MPKPAPLAPGLLDLTGAALIVIFRRPPDADRPDYIGPDFVVELTADARLTKAAGARLLRDVANRLDLDAEAPACCLCGHQVAAHAHAEAGGGTSVGRCADCDCRLYRS